MLSIFRSTLRQPTILVRRVKLSEPSRLLSTTITTSNLDMASGNAKFATSRLYDVEGWVCVVTGGGTGIGLMIAQAFANNGARVYITGRRPEVLEQATKTWGKSLLNPRGQIIPVPADITDKASIEHLFNEVSKHEKHVDVLVNNAGVSIGTSTVEKGDESAQALKDQLWNEDLSEWETVYRTNVIG